MVLHILIKFQWIFELRGNFLMYCMEQFNLPSYGNSILLFTLYLLSSTLGSSIIIDEQLILRFYNNLVQLIV